MSEDGDKGLWLIKWGGSLITDKSRPTTARPEVLTRLAEELAGLAAAHPGRIVLGHGSGSFGHVAAHRHGLAGGLRRAEQRIGVARTQAEVAALHRLVIDALLAAGLPTFSVVPGSVLMTGAGRPEEADWAPVWAALELGLLPVVHGDVVLDRRQGCAILSTERVFVEIAAAGARRGRPPRRVFWLGETDGVWDAEGRSLRNVGSGDLESLAAAAGGSAGTDVTGGMRHRLEGARALLRLGAESWVLDGREPGVIERVLAGDRRGTRIAP